MNVMPALRKTAWRGGVSSGKQVSSRVFDGATHKPQTSVPGGTIVDRLTAMETFVCVVESGSFSAAARLLNVGQPAVSKSIAQLEERLAVRLLLRSTRGLLPTEAGLAFFGRGKRPMQGD